MARPPRAVTAARHRGAGRAGRRHRRHGGRPPHPRPRRGAAAVLRRLHPGPAPARGHRRGGALDGADAGATASRFLDLVAPPPEDGRRSPSCRARSPCPRWWPTCAARSPIHRPAAAPVGRRLGAAPAGRRGRSGRRSDALVGPGAAVRRRPTRARTTRPSACARRRSRPSSAARCGGCSERSGPRRRRTPRAHGGDGGARRRPAGRRGTAAGGRPRRARRRARPARPRPGLVDQRQRQSAQACSAGSSPGMPRRPGLIGVEVEFDVTVGRARIRGKVDRLERDGEGRLVVVDLKTGKTAGQEHRGARAARATRWPSPRARSGTTAAFPGGAALLQVGGAPRPRSSTGAAARRRPAGRDAGPVSCSPRSGTAWAASFEVRTGRIASGAPPRSCPLQYPAGR